MQFNNDNKMVKIGIFYDGNFFAYVSNYYCYHHPQKQRLSIKGLHDFVTNRIAQYENISEDYCHIVSSHYFRGRLSATDAKQRNALFNERVFDHVLMTEGVITHYLPAGPRGERSIDLPFALEVYEQSILKQLNVVVLVASDGDFVPLVKKIHTLGIRVMVLGWDFNIEVEGHVKETITSQKLLAESTYPEMMSEVILDGISQDDPIIENIFVLNKEERRTYYNEDYDDPAMADELDTPPGTPGEGRIKTIKNGFGFITPDDDEGDLYFYWADIVSGDFTSLEDGDRVRYEKTGNARGPCAKNIEVL
jgi:cold shock CspA family protein